MGQTTQRRHALARGHDPFWTLVATARRLQAPGGCPWDRAQTIASLVPHLVEEAWEVFDSSRGRRYIELKEELGDVLYTVVFLTLIAERRGLFTLSGLLATTREKMIRRHPHVFGTTKASTPQEAYLHWQAAKWQERPGPSRSKTLRPLLLALWEWMRTDQRAVRMLKDLIATHRRGPRPTGGSGRKQRASEAPARPSARPWRTTGR